MATRFGADLANPSVRRVVDALIVRALTSKGARRLVARRYFAAVERKFTNAVTSFGLSFVPKSLGMTPAA